MICLILALMFFDLKTALAAQVIDTDADGLADEIELALGTNPEQVDTDGDGYEDGREAANGFNPLKGDRDRSLPRSVKVDLTTQRLRYYLNSVELGAIPVSTGLPIWATPTGEFKILRKRPIVHYRGVGYNYPNTKWNLEFKRGYYLHGAYWHNQFGKRPMSHGCVNIAYANAEKLWRFLRVGDKVAVTGKTPRRVAPLSVLLDKP